MPTAVIPTAVLNAHFDRRNARRPGPSGRPYRDVALLGYFFDKTVANLTSGVNPATTAAPGDKLRYTLRFRTTIKRSTISAFSTTWMR